MSAKNLVEIYIEARRGWQSRQDGVQLSLDRPSEPEKGAVIYLAKIPIPPNNAPNPVRPIGVDSFEECTGENNIGV